MERLYRVIFDTQRDRRFISWGFYVSANNKKEAKEKAFLAWNSSDNHIYGDKPHMFHVDAARVQDDERDRQMLTFYKMEEKYAFWGKKQ